MDDPLLSSEHELSERPVVPPLRPRPRAMSNHDLDAAVDLHPVDSDTDTGMRWVDMILLVGPEIVAERLKNSWENIGISAALTTTMAFAGIFVAPPDDGSSVPRTICIQLYALSMTISFFSSILAVAFAVLLISRINRIPRNTDLKWFLMRYQMIHELPPKIFEVGLLSLVLGVAFVIYPIFNLGVASVGFSICIPGMLGFYKMFTRMKKEIDGRLTSAIDNLPELRHAFKKLDANGDGVLTLEEINTAMEQDEELRQGLGLDPKKNNEIFKAMDLNGDNFIRWSEFKVYFGKAKADTPSAHEALTHRTLADIPK